MLGPKTQRTERVEEEKNQDLNYFYETQIRKYLDEAETERDGGQRRMSVLSRLTRGFESVGT